MWSVPLVWNWMFITVFTSAHPEPRESTPNLFNFLKINFNISPWMPTSSKSGFQVSPSKLCMNFFSVLRISYTPPILSYPPWFDHPYLVGNTNYDVSLVQFPPASCISHLDPKVLLDSHIPGCTLSSQKTARSISLSKWLSSVT